MTTTIEIKGTCKDGFQRVKEAFAANFADHGEVGASLAVMVDGKTHETHVSEEVDRKKLPEALRELLAYRVHSQNMVTAARVFL